MRKVLLILSLLFLAPALQGCETFRGITNVVKAATTTVANPVGREELYNLEASYRAALSISVAYRRYCYSAPLAQLPQVICGRRRAVVLKMQDLDRTAYRAVVTARNAIEGNSTISVASAFGIARQAIADFKNVVDPYVNVPR